MMFPVLHNRWPLEAMLTLSVTINLPAIYCLSVTAAAAAASGACRTTPNQKAI